MKSLRLLCGLLRAKARLITLYQILAGQELAWLSTLVWLAADVLQFLEVVMPEKEEKMLTLGEAAKSLGVDTWQVQRLFERGLLPEPARFGRYRMVKESELPTVREALKKAGYLKS